MKRGPTRKRESADDEDTTQDMQADINWLKNTPKVNQSRDTLLKKMAATNTLRRSLVNKGSAAAEIFKEFPCFRSTPGLVSIDLVKMSFISAKQELLVPLCLLLMTFFRVWGLNQRVVDLYKGLFEKMP